MRNANGYGFLYQRHPAPNENVTIRKNCFGEMTGGNALLSVFVALQRVGHGPAFSALQPADQLTLASKFQDSLWPLRLAAK